MSGPSDDQKDFLIERFPRINFEGMTYRAAASLINKAKEISSSGLLFDIRHRIAQLATSG